MICTLKCYKLNLKLTFNWFSTIAKYYKLFGVTSNISLVTTFTQHKNKNSKTKLKIDVILNNFRLIIAMVSMDTEPIKRLAGRECLMH